MITGDDSTGTDDDSSNSENSTNTDGDTILYIIAGVIVGILFIAILYVVFASCSSFRHHRVFYYIDRQHTHLYHNITRTATLKYTLKYHEYMTVLRARSQVLFRFIS